MREGLPLRCNLGYDKCFHPTPQSTRRGGPGPGVLGRGQAVRRRPLEPVFEGSNPSAPTKFCHVFCVAKLGRNTTCAAPKGAARPAGGRAKKHCATNRFRRTESVFRQRSSAAGG